MTTWLLLHYKLPNKPSALRVYTWRKLKRLGAILLHESVWILPDSSRAAEQIQWLTAEIQEMGGETFFWRANAVNGENDENLKKHFIEQVDVVYAELLKKLEKSRADLQEISRLYQQTAAQDFFHSKLGTLVREKLTAKRGDGS